LAGKTSYAGAAVCCGAGEYAPPGDTLCSPVDVVAYMGFEYRTRDGASPTRTDTTSVCEGSYAALPSGFEIAPSNLDSKEIGMEDPWGTLVVMFSGGCVSTTQYEYNTWYGQPLSDGCTNPSDSGANILQSGNQYATNGCPSVILVRRACAAGSYQDSTRIIYTQGASATCTFCPAGNPPLRRPPSSSPPRRPRLFPDLHPRPPHARRRMRGAPAAASTECSRIGALGQRVRSLAAWAQVHLH